MSGPSGPNGGGNMIEGINVTPLVDIMLVLLIIVMVTAQFTSSSAVPMDLPQASESEEVQTVFAVTVPADGELQVDGEAIERSALEGRASAALDETPDLRAVIQADGAVPHRRVMDVMDELRAAGLTKVAFAAESEKSGAESSEGDDGDDGEK
jgi:biopolymer transport protein ExbD